MEKQMRCEDSAILLIKASLHHQKISKEELEQVDLDDLYRFCKCHGISALVSNGMAEPDLAWQKAKMESIRRTVLFDAERKKIVDFLNENKIWFCFLKGIVIKDLYPKYGLREMSDNDILIDESKARLVRDYMIKNGYSNTKFGASNHDEYYKEPIYNFEMHRALFNDLTDQKFPDYYTDVKRKLFRLDDSSYEYRFNDEDFYIYMMAHFHKHLSESGSGLRPLVDQYIYLSKKKELNRKYIENELSKLGIFDEEIKLKKLGFKLFSKENDSLLTEEEKELLKYICSSGLYGNRKNKAENQLNRLKSENEKHYKLRYIYRRLFLPEEVLKNYHPFFYRNVWARPFLMMYRVGKGLLFHNKMIMIELDALTEKDNENDEI